MTSPTTAALLVTFAIAIAGFCAVYLLRRRERANTPQSSTPSVTGDAATAAASPSVNADAIPYATDATIEVAAQCYRIAFGVARFDYQIFEDHAQVIERVEAALGDAANNREYFPRRPLLLPKLLQALNDTESTRHELVRLILEDPTLAGTTLKRANNAFYRMSAQPVESLDRAVAILGVDGLRGLLSTAIMQPVFRLPKGFFDSFADIAWELAQGSAAGAQRYAERSDADDPFVAQLLGVLRALASLVLFRVTLDKYREQPNVMPRPEVFIRILQLYRSQVAIDIAKTWQLTSGPLDALEEQRNEVSPSHMTMLGRAIYYGELTAAMAIALRRDASTQAAAEQILTQQGLTLALARELLEAANDPEHGQH